MEIDIEDVSKGTMDDKTKQVTWKISLQPRYEKRILLKYKVRYSSDKKNKLE